MAQRSIAAHNRNFIDMTGRRCERLIVTGFSHLNKSNGNAQWHCVCDCGNVCIVDGHDLRTGHTLSCGCVQIERARIAAQTHGEKPTKGGTREYRAWHYMKTRCLNPHATAYPWYGARGITVCARWVESFEAFLADMGRCPPGYELDRINNDGNYEPGNCRWTTKIVNSNNRRPRSCHRR